MTPREKTLALRILAVLGVLLLAWGAKTFHRLSYRDFTVRNGGLRPIRVLALAATPDGFAPLWSRDSDEYRTAIRSGREVRFRYNSDAATLCGLLVVADGAPPGMLENPEEGWKCPLLPGSTKRLCCWPTGDAVLEVPPLTRLQPVPEAFAPLLESRGADAR